MNATTADTSDSNCLTTSRAIQGLIGAARAVGAEPSETALAALRAALSEIDGCIAEHRESEALIEAAKDKCLRWSDSDVEIDDFPLISQADGGTWVLAWVWVADGDEDEGDE